MTVLTFLVLLGAVLWWALKRPRNPKAPPARAATNTPPSRAWRAARNESDGLHIAVDALDSHISLLQQISDQWLMWANLWTHDPAHFRANVGHAQSIASRLDHDAETLVSEVRRLERLRDSVAVFEHRRAHAERLTNEAGVLGAALHARLLEVASGQGLDASGLVATSYRATPLPSLEAVRNQATALEDQRLRLKEVLA